MFAEISYTYLLRRHYKCAFLIKYGPLKSYEYAIKTHKLLIIISTAIDIANHSKKNKTQKRNIIQKRVCETKILSHSAKIEITLLFYIKRASLIYTITKRVNIYLLTLSLPITYIFVLTGRDYCHHFKCNYLENQRYFAVFSSHFWNLH